MSEVTSEVVSVNVALPVWVPETRSTDKTAINKQPVTGDVAVRTLGLEGDEVGDKKFHGGVDQAVYAFAREDLDLWSDRLGRHLPSGSMFGENLTTGGIDVNGAVLGETWRVGSALLEVCSVRIPCKVFANWLGMAGYENAGWMKRFIAEGRPGPYLRVLEEGRLRAGDVITVESRPDHGVSVSTMFRALTTERSLLPDLLRYDRLPAKFRTKVERSLLSRNGPESGRNLPSSSHLFYV